MENLAIISGVVFFLVLLYLAVRKARKVSKEQSSLDMHPDNYKKPDIEQVSHRNDPDTKHK